jgi:hypothetical protein
MIMRTTFTKFAKHLRKTTQGSQRFAFYWPPPKHVLFVDGKRVESIEVDNNETLSCLNDDEYFYEGVSVREPLRYELYKKVI